eukprot:1157222-Pelagomonas_calceolata.AAC.7
MHEHDTCAQPGEQPSAARSCFIITFRVTAALAMPTDTNPISNFTKGAKTRARPIVLRGRFVPSGPTLKDGGPAPQEQLRCFSGIGSATVQRTEVHFNALVCFMEVDPFL